MVQRFPDASALVDLLPWGVALHDAKGQISLVNPAAERILGLSLDEMRGITSMDPRWRATREDGTPFPGEGHPAMIALRTGSPVRDVVMGVFNPRREATTWINVRAIPIRVEGENSVAGVYALFEDISSRMSAQQGERESETRFRSSFAAMSDGRRPQPTVRHRAEVAFPTRYVGGQGLSRSRFNIAPRCPQ